MSYNPAYTIYYHGACKGFTGRATHPMMLLAHTGRDYTVVTPDQYTGTAAFAPPFVKTPTGATISQTPAIMIALGQAVGLSPADPIKKAKAIQVELDAADIMVEAKDFKEKPERAAKWIGHCEALLAGGYAAGDALSHADFSLYVVLSMMPGLESPNIKAWLAKMEETKGVKAIKALGLPVMPPGM